MKRKILLLVMLFALVACFFAISASAVEIDGVNYKLNSTTKEATVDDNCSNTSTTIVIPETVEYDGVTYNVTAIVEKAFNGNKSITTLVIYPKLTSIPSYMIQSATNLKKLYIDFSEVTSIGERALTLASSNDSSLASGVGFNFYKPESYTAGDESTDVMITELVLDKVTSIGAAAFNSAKLNKAVIGSSCKSMGVQTFRHSTITEMDTAATLVPDYFCNSNPYLEKITIRNAKTIGSNSFAGCTNVAKVYIDMSNVTSVGGYAFVLSSKYDAGNSTTKWYNLDGKQTIDMSNMTHIYGQAFASSNLGSNGETTIIWPEELQLFNDECLRKCNISGPLFLNAAASANLTAHYWALEGNSFDIAIFGPGFKTIGAKLTSATLVISLAEATNISRSDFLSASGAKTFYCGELTGNTSFSNTTVITILGGTALHTATCGYGAKVTYPDITYEIIGNFSHTEDPNGVSTTPSCTTPTGTEYFCSICGLSTRYEISAEAPGHNFSTLVSSTPLSCIADQTETYKCSACDATILTTIAKATGHSYEVSIVAEAVIGTDGTKKYVCINFDGTCGDTHEVKYKYAPDDLDVKVIMKTGETYTIKAKDIFNITINDTITAFECYLSSIKSSFTVDGVTLNRSDITYISIPYGFTHASKGFSSTISTVDFTDAGDIILKSTFQDNTSVTEIILGNGIQLRADAFRYCDLLSIIRIADGANVVFSSSYNPFFDSKGIDKIIIGKNANVRFERGYLIGYGKATKRRLSSIEFGDGATVYFGDNCFKDEKELATITFGVGSYTFGQSAFQNAPITSVIIPEGSNVAFDSTKTFYGCTALESVFLPSSVTAIPNETFSGCTAIKTAMLMAVTSIGENAFNATTDNTLTVFSHATGDLTISSNAFANRANVVLYTTSSNVTTIPATAYTIYSGIHHSQYEASLDPTCLEDGYDGYATDCLCGNILSEVTFDIYSSDGEPTTGSYGVHTIIPNLGGHIDKVVIAYALGFDKAGELSIICSRCDATVKEASAIEPIFVHKGYSYRIDGGEVGIYSAFDVNRELLTAYETANNTTLTFGMIVVNPKYLGDTFFENGVLTASEGAVQTSIDIGDFSTFSCLISGFQRSDAFASLELIIAGYVYEGDDTDNIRLMQKTYAVGEDAPVVSKVTKGDQSLYTVSATGVRAPVALPADIKEYGSSSI